MSAVKRRRGTNTCELSKLEPYGDEKELALCAGVVVCMGTVGIAEGVVALARGSDEWGRALAVGRLSGLCSEAFRQATPKIAPQTSHANQDCGTELMERY